MASSRLDRGDRPREAREEAVRKRRLSIRVGVAGIALLFAGAILTLVWPDYLVALLVVMSIGFVLILVALLIIRNVTGSGSVLKGLVKTL